ncbi:MAG: hypothetical protein ACREKN_00155 [Longimicrobiaceae bacterium]
MRNRIHLVAPQLVVLMAACAPALSAPQGVPVDDAARVEQSASAALLPDRPGRADFGWELNEQGTRLHGRGVARYQAPRRLRIDLFGPRGETYLAAALVDGEYRIPAALEGRVRLPSPSLLWAALGVLEPPGGELSAALSADSVLTLRYSRPGDEAFGFEIGDWPGDPRLLSSRASRSGSVTESVQLEAGPAGGPGRARYRNWAEYRDLTLTFEKVADAGPFDPSLWSP